MKLRNNVNLIQISFRSFAPPPPKKAGGPPGSAPAAPAKPILKTQIQKLIEKGTEFPLGPPPGANKTYGAHRDGVVPKLEPRIEIFAKKLRDVYINQGVIRDQKEYIEYVRDR